MAEGLAASAGFVAESAGVVAAGVHPRAVEAMAEIGVDISTHRSRTIDQAREAYDYIVTLCDYALSLYPNRPEARRHRLHLPVPDPITVTGSTKEVRRAFRQARDEIAARLRAELFPLLESDGMQV